MILDAELILAEKQDLKSAFTSKALDLGQANPDLGMYPQFFLVLVPTTDFVGTSLTINLQDCDTATGSFATCAAATVKVTDIKGDIVAFRFPVTHKRYVKVNVAPTSITAGAATIAITDNFDKPSWLFRDTVEFFEPDPDAMKIDLTTKVKGILPVVNGGTGKDTAGG